MTDTYNRTPMCPTCGSAAVVRIVYGFPTREGFEAARRGEIVLGGCVIEADAPLWACKACHESFRRIIPEAFRERRSGTT